MSDIFLDTSAYSAFLAGHPAIKTAVQRADGLTINPIVMGELLAGFLKGRRLEWNRQQLKLFLASPRVRMVVLDEGTAERYAVIRNTLLTEGKPIPTNDIWIAASALQHGLELVTTDRHFAMVMHVVVRYYPPSGDA